MCQPPKDVNAIGYGHRDGAVPGECEEGPAASLEHLGSSIAEAEGVKRVWVAITEEMDTDKAQA